MPKIDQKNAEDICFINVKIKESKTDILLLTFQGYFYNWIKTIKNVRLATVWSRLKKNIDTHKANIIKERETN